MKISVLTRNINESKSLSIIREASKISVDIGSNILILPGYHPCGKPEYSYIKEVQEISSSHKINILIDIKESTFLVSPDNDNIEFIQRVARGIDSKEEYKELSVDIEDSQRDFTIDNQIFRVLLCGENNYFKNERNNLSEVNKAKKRYSDMFWNDKYDFLLNPAHTTMGQWNLLNKRFEKLSQNNKIVIFTTNRGKIEGNCIKGNYVVRDINSWGTALRVYKNGSLVVDGELKGQNLQIHKETTWRLVTFDQGKL